MVKQTVAVPLFVQSPSSQRDTIAGGLFRSEQFLRVSRVGGWNRGLTLGEQSAGDGKKVVVECDTECSEGAQSRIDPPVLD